MNSGNEHTVKAFDTDISELRGMVAEIGGRNFTGYFAWLIWLVIHITQLIGFRSRVQVLINWAWSYLTFENMVRLIQPTLGEQRREAVESEIED